MLSRKGIYYLEKWSEIVSVKSYEEAYKGFRRTDLCWRLEIWVLVYKRQNLMKKGKRGDLVILKLIKGCHKFGLADDDRKRNSKLKVLG